MNKFYHVMATAVVSSVLFIAASLPATAAEEAAAPALAPAASVVVAPPVNVNTATVEELTKVKGIGEKRAEAIVTYRKAHGDFKSVDDVANVKGIGKKFLIRIESRLTVK